MSLVSPRGRDLAIWLSIFTVAVLAITALRFYVIIKLKPRPFHVEDAFIILSIVSMLALEGPSYWAIHNGLGAHTATLHWDNIAVQIKLLLSATWTWTISTCSCKISLLFLYLRLFQPVPILRKLVWALIALNVAYVIVFITFFNTQCSPYWAAWDPVLSQTNCRPIVIQEIASVAVNLILDFIVVVLPIPFVVKLQMPTAKKIAVCGMFSLGFGVIGILSWRLYTTLHPSQPPDTVYDLYITALQSHLELYFGIIAANLPILGPFLKRIPKTIVTFRTFGSKNSSSSPSSSANKKSHQLVTFGSWGGHGSSSGGARKNNGDELYLLTRDDERTTIGTVTNATITSDADRDRIVGNGNGIGIAIGRGQIYQSREFGVSSEPSDEVTGSSSGGGGINIYRTRAEASKV